MAPKTGVTTSHQTLNILAEYPSWESEPDTIIETGSQRRKLVVDDFPS